MINFFCNLELQLFFFINQTISNSIFDLIFTFFHHAHKNIWFILFVILIWLFFIYKHEKNRLILILFIPFGILITDQIGDTIKNFELRQRPYMNLDNSDINLLVKVNKKENGDYKTTSSSKKSFPSNHSANIFFIYFILSTLYPNKSKYFLILALMISISRVYVGVHYPFDVMVGISIGLITGVIIRKILIWKNIVR